MAVITSYDTLQTAVADYLARDDLTTFVPNFIQNAEGKIYRTLKIRDMETSFTGTITSGVIALPTRYLSLKNAYVSESPVTVLTRVGVEEIYRRFPIRTGSSIPTLIATEEDNFIFGEYGEGRAIAGTYYQYYEPLRTTSPNWYVTNAPELLLYGSLIEAEPFMDGDERLMRLLPVWQSMFAEAAKTLKNQKTSQEQSGSGLRAVAI